MKTLRLIATAAIAVSAVLGLLGASSALAAQTTICKASEGSYCLTANRYPSGTALQASASKVELGFNFFGIPGTMSCIESSLKGSTSAQAGEPLPVSLTTWSFGNCTTSWNSENRSCTASAQYLPYAGSLAWTEGAKGSLTVANGGSGRPALNIACENLISCTYYLEPKVTFDGSSTASLAIAEQTLTIKNGAFGCATSLTVKPATYSVSSPAPAYVAKAEDPPPSGTLCKANEIPCAGWNSYPSGTELKGEASNVVIQTALFSGQYKVTCKSSSLTLKSQALRQNPLPMELIGFAFQDCFSSFGEETCEVISRVTDSSGVLTHSESEGGAGWLSSVGYTVSFACGHQPIACTYGSNSKLSQHLWGGNPASIFEVESLTALSGLCTPGTTGTLTASSRYSLSPKPLYDSGAS
jgi:hypothetical protein